MGEKRQRQDYRPYKDDLKKMWMLETYGSGRFGMNFGVYGEFVKWKMMIPPQKITTPQHASLPWSLTPVL